MELIWNEIGALRLICRDTEQAELEGTLPPPQGRTVSEILDYTAETSLDACRTDGGRLETSGRITVKLIAADESGEAFAFTSESTFSRQIVNEAFEPGQLASVNASIASLSIRQAPDRRILLSAAIDLEYTVTTALPLRVLSGVSGVSDMEFKTRTVASSRRVELGSAIFRLSEEISEVSDNVLSHSMHLSVRDTSFEDGGVTVSGIASLNLICRSAEGDIVQIVRNLPFRENVETSGAADEVYASAQLRTSSVRTLGTEFSLLGFDADIELSVYTLREQNLALPLDAFSPSINFNCIKQDATLLSTLGGRMINHTLRENVTVPDGLSDIFTALSASTRAVLTSVSFMQGEMLMEGLLVTRLIYRSSGGRLYSFAEDVPFSLRSSAPIGTSFAKLNIFCTPTVTGGSARAAQITYNIDIAAEFCSLTEVEVVAGLAENNAQNGDACEDAPSGLVIHTVGSNEELFDVAKRFCIPSARVRELNPGCENGIREGQKVLLIV